jgi:hypothetical protein
VDLTMSNNYLSANDLRTTGILQEVNRRLLHPMGIAMELRVEKSEDGSIAMDGKAFVQFRDLREEPEGFCFSEFDSEDFDKYCKFGTLFLDKMLARVSKLGYHVQPIPHSFPKNLEEALTQLEQYLSAEAAEEFRVAGPGSHHHGLGTLLRNKWCLWHGSPLAQWFGKMGVWHAGDMSGIILTSLHRRLCGNEIDFEGQVASYQAYWKEQCPKS